jgi:glyoxylase-like metal-dependent hydrolase (beta-lactamase superfamily II)
MRAIALHPDLIVFVSDAWQTTCTAVRGGDEGFVIDSPIFPEELRALPEVLDHAGFPVSGLLATHADWDHLLGRTAFPQAPLGCSHSTAERLSTRLGHTRRKLRAFDQEHYIQDRPRLSLGALQPLPVPGRLQLGDSHELELLATEGHTPDGTAYWLGWTRTLVCGDYLSPVEIPMLSEGGSIETYRATLARLGELLEAAEWVVPGHGEPIGAARAREILAEDDAYLELLEREGEAAAIPRSRSTPQQKRIHEANLTFATAHPRA